MAAYAGRLARRLGLSDREADQVALGGLLHDVGKLALSDPLFSLCKTDLTAAMWNEVFYHPLIGAALLMQTSDEELVHDAVLYHHERLDGSGYPFGLIDGIPLSAIIVSVADCFDAITTDRPYQQRKSPVRALQILKEMASSLLDADVVDAFIEDITDAGMVCL